MLRRRRRGIHRLRQQRCGVRPRSPVLVPHRHPNGERRLRTPCGGPTSQRDVRARTTTNIPRWSEHSQVPQVAMQCRIGTIRQTRGNPSVAFAGQQTIRSRRRVDLGPPRPRHGASRHVSGNGADCPAVGPRNGSVVIASVIDHDARGLVRDDGEVVECHVTALLEGRVNITSVIVNGVARRQSETSRPSCQILVG